MRILIVEDEYDIRSVLEKRLKKQYSVDACGDGLEALDFIHTYSYDLMIFDIMLPGLDGISLVKKVRKEKMNTPIIMLTAKDSIDDRILGLDSGADDYLCKPFAYEELLARIRVLMRRKQDVAKDNRLRIDNLVVDTATCQVTRGDKSITLSSREYMVLEYLMRNQKMILSRRQIEERAWNHQFEGGSNIVDVYIRYLRRKIDLPGEKKLIHTVRGFGYCLKVDEADEK